MDSDDRGREWLRTTLYSIGDAVVTTDALGRVREMNPVAEALTGWTEAEAAGRPFAEVFVAAGTLMNQQGAPFSGTLSVTEVPTELTPATAI